MKGQRQRKTTVGFTIVEMLAVILVIGILVAVVVGVAGNATAKAAEALTGENMAAMMNAIDIYREVKGKYPSDSGDYRTANAALITQLASCPASNKRLGALSDSAIKVSGGTKYFQDGFEQILRYKASGGAGGAAYLESAGRDGDFTTTADNIRSDGM